MTEDLDGGIHGAIKRGLQYGNFRYKCFCFLLDKLGYSNHQIHDLEVRNKVYRYLKKHYSKYLETIYYSDRDSGAESGHVWCCWLQGLENAPDIVKACIKSFYKWLPDKELHVISQENMLEYVELPEHIINKWKAGIISDTLFSDFIRLSVLIRYGGIWLDATVFLTGSLPQYIKDSRFFMFQSNVYDITKTGESWFIKANSQNRVLRTALDLLNKYWENENKIRDYFIMFIFMKMAGDKYPDDMVNMRKVSSALPLLMQNHLTLPYDQVMFEEICRISSIHKLTHKVHVREDLQYGFYDKVLELGLD